MSRTAPHPPPSSTGAREAAPRTVGGARLALLPCRSPRPVPPTAAPSAAGRPPSGSAAAASARPGARSPRRPRRSLRATASAGDHTGGPDRPGRRRGLHVPHQRGARARPGARRRAGARRRDPARRRARRRQEHAAARGRRPDRPRPAAARSTSPARSPPSQVRLRADRTGGVHDELFLAAETDLGAVLTHIEEVRPTLLVVDSIQTIGASGIDGVPGGVTQVKEVAAALIRVAKTRNITTVHRRPRHQGRLDRRPAGARAPRRRGAALRGRPQLPVPDGPGDEEPLRPGRRGRLLRPRPPTASPRSPTRPACSSSTTTARCPAPASR